MLQALPIGSSDFSTLRENNEIYVDKTALMFQLAKSRGKIFLARPRRFGKSLLISTFDSLFRDGLKHFRGLEIEKLWTDKTYPVVRLDFSEIKEVKTAEDFKKTFTTSWPPHSQGKRIRSSAATPIRSAMEKGALEAVIDYFNAVVTAIDYHRYPIKDEASCRAYMQVLLIGAAMIPKVEIHNAHGRSGMEVEVNGQHWVSSSSLLAAHRKSPTYLMRQSINSVPVTTGRHPSTQIASVWHWFSTAKNDDSRLGNGPKSLQTGSHSLNPSRPDTTDTH